MSNIKKFPSNSWDRIRIRRGKRSVSCIVSDRWLRFGAVESASKNLGTPVWLDVMTDAVDGNNIERSRKLCTLVVTVEQIEDILRTLKQPK